MDRAILEKAVFVGLLLLVILFGFYIRSAGNVPDKILSYDPLFQYRFTKYYVDFGQLPAWDELSYYVGRAVSNSAPGLMFYLTALIYAFTKGFGWSLITTATFASAWYGALIAVPAFLLAREFSNKWGGLFGAALTISAPQILVRTFGASFDTDQFSIFFILLALWAGFYAMKRRTVFSVFLASTCFVLFASAWQDFWYPFFFMIAAGAIYATLKMALAWKSGDDHRKAIFSEAKSLVLVVVSIFAMTVIASSLLGYNPIQNLFSFVNFA
jgi:asparagine N-glycosylation enzyme membrane subunit Stt3